VRRWSLYWLSQHDAWPAILFIIAGLAALALLAGMRTRLATLVSFVLLLSLHNRAPILLQGGDILLLLLLFWALFLPWGERWSKIFQLPTANPLHIEVTISRKLSTGSKSTQIQLCPEFVA